MSRMVRKQFYIEEATANALAERAQALGLDQAELVRTALRAFLEGAGSTDRKRRAWQEFREFAQQRSSIEVCAAARGWDREDAHAR